MADYYPLLSRAVRNLPDNTPEARQAIFLRARDALDRQLRSITPRLNDADVIRELLSLEDVIRRIEREIDDDASKTDESLRRVEDAVAALHTPDPALSAGDAPTYRPAPPDEADAPMIRPGLRPSLTIAPQRQRADRADWQPAAPISEAPSPAQEASLATAYAKPEGATPSGGRIRLPTDADGARKRKRLVLFAVLGVVALIGMGALALMNREKPGRYQSTEAPPRPQGPVVDPSKQEGRLLGEASQPSPPPVEVPQRQVQSVPVPAPVAPSTATSEQAPLPVVSRAFLVLEVPGRNPNQYEGVANWSFSADPASRSPEKALRAVVEFAGAGLGFDISIARATDPGLNASHIVTLNFTPNQGIPAVREIGALDWREREGQPGAPLVGTLVPIQDNLFMIGLDATEAGRTRNLELIRSQRWVVFEIRLADNRMGAFLIEKGSTGDKAVEEALAAWR